jgi:hypothetical protein
MRKISLILSVLFSVAIFAQTAKEIINKNIEISGGLSNWKSLNSVLLQGKVTLGISDEYSIKIFQQRPNLTKTVIIIGKKENVIEGFDGKKSYVMNYTLNKLIEDNNQEIENFESDFIDFENKGFTAKYIGKEKLGEIYCHKIEITKNTNKITYFFDIKNYMLIKEEREDETIIYSDYKKTGNFIMPYRIESSSAKKNSDYVMIINKIEINKTFPSNTFKF